MSISCTSNSWRRVVVVILSVGTNGKLVIEPLPVTKIRRLQAGADLAGDALEVVARAVHEIKAGRVHRLRVVDHVVEGACGILFVRGAEGF